MKNISLNTGLLVTLFLICLHLTISSATIAQTSAFQIIPLGIKGGIDESNLSSYAVAVAGTNDYACLDAGTIHAGIQKTIDGGVWRGDAILFQKNNIKGYLISHPHLDHLSGMIINATDDSPKQIYATESCINTIKDKYFSWKNWANFTNEGEKPTLNKYSFIHLVPGTELQIQNTTMFVTPFVLSHGNPYESTAFLIRHNENFLLYLGDTGADEIEKSNKLELLWKSVSHLIQQQKLKAIFIEVSYANEQPTNLLFGHLTPRLLMNEMSVLAKLAGTKGIQAVPVVITHMKPSGDREVVIKKQLSDLNVLTLNLVFPEQGHPLEF